MTPSEMFCPNQDCPKHGLRDQGNLSIHSRAERRFRCWACGRTFSVTTATPYYRLRSPQGLVCLVVTLVAYGCPPQAIVKAFGIDERTVSDWLKRAGEHCQRVHEE